MNSKKIPIMLRTGTELPTLLEKYMTYLKENTSLSFIQRRHLLAEYCRDHGKTREEITAETGETHMKYALCRQSCEQTLQQTEYPDYETFSGAYQSPLGWRDIRSVTVVEVERDRPWTIITSIAEPHTEQVVYLDAYYDTGWNGFRQQIQNKTEG